MSTLSVVIPALNEEDGIGQVVTGLLALPDMVWENAGVQSLELLVIDDGSTDRTGPVAADAAAALGRGDRLRVIRHVTRRGYGAALHHGFRLAGGDLLAFLDADNTYPAEALPELCAEVAGSGAAMVVGNRMGRRRTGMPITRRVGNAFFALLVSRLAGARVTDSASGMRVLRREVYQQLRPLPAGLDFTPAMTVRALQLGMGVREVDIPYHERIGRSKLNVLRDGLRFLRTIVQETRTNQPDRLWRALRPAALWTFLALGGAVVGWSAAQRAIWGVGLSAAAVLLVIVIAGLVWAGLGVSMRTRPAASHVGEASQNRRSARPDGYAHSGETDTLAG